MKESTYRLIIIVLLLVILLGGSVIAYQRFAPQVELDSLSQTEQTGEENGASDFTVYDRDGDPVKLSDFSGTPVVLNFWASWCGPCKSEMPEFQELFETYGDRVQFMMINLTDGYSDTVESAAALVDEAGYTFPVYFDTAMEAAAAYSVSAIPVTCFIDADGNLVRQNIGMLSASALEQGIQSILNQ